MPVNRPTLAMLDRMVSALEFISQSATQKLNPDGGASWQLFGNTGKTVAKQWRNWRNWRNQKKAFSPVTPAPSSEAPRNSMAAATRMAWPILCRHRKRQTAMCTRVNAWNHHICPAARANEDGAGCINQKHQGHQATQT